MEFSVFHELSVCGSVCHSNDFVWKQFPVRWASKTDHSQPNAHFWSVFFCLQYFSHSSPEKGVSRVSLSSHSIHFFAQNIPMDCESFNVFRKIERQIPL